MTDVPSRDKPSPEKYAACIKSDWMPENYTERVDESILGIKFSPDIFQKQAFYLLSTGNSVFVSAHTSSGKTLVAEYAIELSIRNSTRVIYTSPIKALSNQKFFDFKQKFSDVGIITGDVQVNPTAKCLIMTTEILRNLVYKNSDILRDTQFVVFDEVHYINDQQRGVVWEECIIMLPDHISLIMLSATIPNSLEFAEWVGRTKERCVYVISTNKRAVPLEFLVYSEGNVFTIDDPSNKRHIKGPSNFNIEIQPFIKRTRSKGKFRINDLGNFINNKRLVPAIFFAFSKKSCEEHGKSLQLLDFTTLEEKNNIEKFLAAAMSNLREEDRCLPQIRTMCEQVYRGIAVHHGSLLPFVKECIEILFSENLIKILVATETFAMGVNMPAKCCVFLNLTKIDGKSFRYLTTGEFIQMSGRAGRRGMDSVGTVLIADPHISDISIIRSIIAGIPVNLSSQFKLSFSLILMALISSVEVEDLMRSSFRENEQRKSLKSDMIKLARLESLPILNCSMCIDSTDFLDDLLILRKEMPTLIKRILKIGDVVVLKDNSTVKVQSIGQFAFNYIEEPLEGGKLFSIPIDDKITTKYRENTCEFMKYPITHRKPAEQGTTEFSSAVFFIKNSEVSFDIRETEVSYICKIRSLKDVFERMIKRRCLHCHSFTDHYLEAIKTRKITEEISKLRSKHSRESLSHIAEYSSRINFLKMRLFIDENGVTLKGRAAAEIRTVNDVVVTELVFNNELENMSPSEIISVFSSMINEDKCEEYSISESLQSKVEILQKYYDILSSDLEDLCIPPFDRLNLSTVQPVFEWCNGYSLGSIVNRHQIQEGAFVRLLLRLDECCKEMIAVGNLIGNDSIVEKFTQASIEMRRDIVFLPSLYI